MDLKSTIVFEKNYDALYNHEARFIINEGGSRSSKTYSALPAIDGLLLTEPEQGR
jgi:ABC-type enterochelin transport system substrate-binding protein